MTRRGSLPAPPPDVIAGSNIDLLRRLRIQPCESMETCWACRGVYPDMPLTRAHVQATVHGGSMDPRNFFLLCDHCHIEQPDGAPREAQEAWLLTAPSVWEWSGAIVDTVTRLLHSAADRLGRRPDTVREFYATSKDAIEKAISEGYRGAAGILNGRANAMAATVRLFERWEPPPVATEQMALPGFEAKAGGTR